MVHKNKFCENYLSDKRKVLDYNFRFRHYNCTPVAGKINKGKIAFETLNVYIFLIKKINFLYLMLFPRFLCQSKTQNFSQDKTKKKYNYVKD
jgi:hypothetical protein